MLKSSNHISTSFMISIVLTSFYCLEINFWIKWGKWIGSSKNCFLDQYMLYHIVVSTTNNNNYCTFLQFSFRTLCQATKRQFSNFWFRIWCIFFFSSRVANTQSSWCKIPSRSVFIQCRDLLKNFLKWQ